MSTANKRSRNWLVTFNSFDDRTETALKKRVEDMAIRYAVFGREKAPTTNHEHLQGFVQFRHVRRFKGVKKFFSKIGQPNVQVGDDKAHAMMLYCKKDGDFWEHGTPPQTSVAAGKKGGEARAKVIRRQIEYARQGKFTKLKQKWPADYVRFYRTWRQINKDEADMPKPLDGVTGTWVYGPSDAGKSHYAREHFPEPYDKPCNKWWDNYKGEENVLLDDFDQSHKCLAHHLKRWADKYGFSGENKGAQINLRPKNVVVTSQYRITEIWDDPKTLDALNRRFRKIKIHIDSQGNRVYQDQGY